MKIKNRDLKRVNLALFSLGNHQGDIKKKWEISKLARTFNETAELLEMEIQRLINEKGTAKQDQKILSVLDPDYVALMDCDIDIKCGQITLEYLEQFNPTIEELMNLGVIIDE